MNAKPHDDPTMPPCPIPSFKDSPVKRYLDFESDKPVMSAFGVPTSSVTLFECESSGLRFRRPPTREQVLAHHGGDYHAFYGASEDEGASITTKEEACRAEWAARVRYLAEFCPSGRVLDVGCSTGVLVEELAHAGYDALGCDISEEACAYARKRLGEDRVFQGTVEEIADGFDEESLDVVTLMDVIEHFADLEEPLAAIRRLLKPGGILFIRTPSLSSPFYRIADWSYRLSMGRYTRAVQLVYHAEHTYFFTRKSIRALLSDGGFDVIQIDPDPLTWPTFSRAELRHGFFVNLVLTKIYFASRFMGGGHGMKVVARKPK